MRAVAAMGVLLATLVVADRGLAMGSAGVAALQVGLQSRGVYSGPIDGVPGPATTQAIRDLERHTGIPITGRLSRRLRDALGSYGRTELGSRSLTPGVSGWDAAEFQFLLAWQGFPSGPFNGHYTQRTARAVRLFQKSHRLSVDGIAGAATIAAVRGARPASPVHLSAPLGYPMTGLFGPRHDRFHTGVDYAAPTGAPVRAPGQGRVTFAGWHPGGWGFLVAIAHGRGVRSMSAHLSRVDVSVGDRVATGETIGAVGSSGNSNGPHLHFEVRLRGAAVNPLTALH